MDEDLFEAMITGKAKTGPSENQLLRDEIVEFLKDKVADKNLIFEAVGKPLGYASDSHILSVALKLADDKKIAAVKGVNRNSKWNFSAMERFEERFGKHDLRQVL